MTDPDPGQPQHGPQGQPGRRTGRRPHPGGHGDPGRGPAAANAPRAADIATRLLHELDCLLDGSRRWVELADRTLAEHRPAAADPARRQIRSADRALSRMGELIGSAMSAHRTALGSPGGTPVAGGRAVTLAEAIDHAADVLRPLAAEHAAELVLRIDHAAGPLPAGPIYTAVLNGLQNAIEAIAARRAGGRGTPRPGTAVGTGPSASSGTARHHAGRVVIEARLIDSPTGRPAAAVGPTSSAEPIEPAGETEPAEPRLVLTITDTGIGLPPTADPREPFGYGFTTKPPGRSGPPAGLGLALVDDIARSLGGSATLERPTATATPAGPATPGTSPAPAGADEPHAAPGAAPAPAPAMPAGAVLTVSYPLSAIVPTNTEHTTQPGPHHAAQPHAGRPDEATWIGAPRAEPPDTGTPHPAGRPIGQPDTADRRPPPADPADPSEAPEA